MITKSFEATFTCGCVWEVELQMVEEPSDEQRLEAATRPSLAVGSGAPFPCPDHGPGQLITTLIETT